MSLLDHIRFCQRRNMSRYRPFIVGGERVGWVEHGLAPRLLTDSTAFQGDETILRLSPAFADFDSRSRAMAEVATRLVADGRLRKLRGEDFPAASAHAGSPLFKIDRNAVALFGIKACGVHMNGF